MRQRQIALLLAVAAVIGVVILATRPHQASDKPAGVTFTGTSAGVAAPSGTAQAGQGTQTFGDSDITAALKSQSRDPNLQAGDFTIISTKQPVNGWYVVVVSPGAGNGDNEKIILTVKNNALSVVLGPGTTLLAADMRDAGVPQAVQDEARAH